MYQSLGDALRALIYHKGLYAARGGQIINHADGYNVRLFSEPDSEEGEIVFELKPCVEPGAGDWLWAATTEEAGQAYRAFEAENSY